MRSAVLCIFALLVGTCSPRALAGEIMVGAASDLAAAMSELAPAFERATGNTMRVSLGSSGNFFAQIEAGAPFDVLLSADVDYPRRLIADGRADAGSLYLYARGRLVLWAAAGGVDVSKGLAVLASAAVRKIAIANPAHAPYGRAAVAALERDGLYPRLRDKLVLGENISQAAQFVQSGNADVGLIALSVALAPAMQAQGRFFELPADSYPTIEQTAVITSGVRDRRTAESFLEFLKSPAGQRILARYGFTPPRDPKP